MTILGIVDCPRDYCTMVQFRGSGWANLKKNNMKLYYNSLFSGHFETCIDSSLNETSKLAPAAMEVNEISKIF